MQIIIKVLEKIHPESPMSSGVAEKMEKFNSAKFGFRVIFQEFSKNSILWYLHTFQIFTWTVQKCVFESILIKFYEKILIKYSVCYLHIYIYGL